MITKPTGFHVRHDFQPALVRELFRIISGFPNGLSQDDIKQNAGSRAYLLGRRKDYSKLLRSLYELELIDEYSSSVRFNSTGKVISALSTIYPHLFAEIIHFLYITHWEKNKNLRFSWSYNQVCDWLWQSAPSSLDNDSLVNLVSLNAKQEYDIQGISFSRASVSGILNWLMELKPACIMKGDDNDLVFSPRTHCPVELFVLALDHEYNLKDTSENSYLRIDDNLKIKVCKICLLRFESFEEMLDLAENSFQLLSVRKERGWRYSLQNFNWESLID